MFVWTIARENFNSNLSWVKMQSGEHRTDHIATIESSAREAAQLGLLRLAGLAFPRPAAALSLSEVQLVKVQSLCI